MVIREIEAVEFDSIDIHRFGNELEINGMILANGKEIFIVPFPDLDFLDENFHIVNIDDMDKECWDKLLFQLDHLETVVRAKDEEGKLQKIILRKSQRQIDSNVSWAVFRRDNYRCQYCGKSDIPLTVDHIIRWENMGQSVEDNLISACRKCNKTRGNMEFEEWLKSDYYLKNIAQHKNMSLGLLINTKKHLEIFEKAKLLPLRKFERSR